MAKDVLVVISGAVLSAGAGLLVGRLWVAMRHRSRPPARPEGPDLAEELEREAAASARSPEDVEAHARPTAFEREA